MHTHVDSPCAVQAMETTVFIYMGLCPWTGEFKTCVRVSCLRERASLPNQNDYCKFSLSQTSFCTQPMQLHQPVFLRVQMGPGDDDHRDPGVLDRARLQHVRAQVLPSLACSTDKERNPFIASRNYALCSALVNLKRKSKLSFKFQFVVWFAGPLGWWLSTQVGARASM